jgi:hypothetical protein
VEAVVKAFVSLKGSGVYGGISHSNEQRDSHSEEIEPMVSE